MFPTGSIHPDPMVRIVGQGSSGAPVELYGGVMDRGKVNEQIFFA